MLTRLLCNASGNGDIDRIRKCIVKRGVNPNFPCTDREAQTPLHFAAGALQLEATQYLLALGANPSAVDCLGFTPLARACLTMATLSDPQILVRGIAILHAHLNHGAEYRVRDKFGNSIVHLLAAKATPAAFTVITKDIALREVDRYKVNNEGKSSSYFDGTMHRALLSLYVLPGWGLLTPIHMAAESGNRPILSLMLQTIETTSDVSSLGGGMLQVVDALGWSPLHWAALRNDVATCQLLRGAGADLHQRDYISRTPLDVALSFQRIDAARILMEQDKEEPSISELAVSSQSDSCQDISESLNSQATAHNSSSTANRTSAYDSGAVSNESRELHTHGNMMHFVLITTSLLVLVCSTAEVGFRNLSILTRQHQLEVIKGLPVVELFLLAGSALVTALVLGCSDQLPTAHLHCLRTARNSRFWRWLADILLCLIALVPIKCGPLMLAHQLLLEERQLDGNTERSLLAESTSPSVVENATPLQSDGASPIPARRFERKLSTQSLLRRTQELWLRPLKLFNYHPPPCNSISDTCMCPRGAAHPYVRTVLVRSEMRADWAPILAPLERLTSADFSKLEEQFDDTFGGGGAPRVYHLVACLWFFQTVIIPRIYQDWGRNQPPTGTTLPTSSEIAGSSQEALRSSILTSQTSNASRRLSAEGAAPEGASEPSEEVSDFDLLKQAETPLRPLSDEGSQEVSYPSAKSRHWMEEMMHAGSPPEIGSSDSYRPDADGSEESEKYSGEDPGEEEADESEEASESIESSYQSSSSRQCEGSRSSDDSEGISRSEDSEVSSTDEHHKLGDKGNLVKLTPQFGLVAPTCGTKKRVFCQPVLAPYAMSGLTADGMWIAFEKWYKEYLRVCDFLHESAVLDCSVLRVDMNQFDDQVPGDLLNVFLQRRLDQHMDMKEYRSKLANTFDALHQTPPGRRTEKEELDCLLKALRIEAEEHAYVGIQPPYVDIDVLNRKRQLDDVRELARVQSEVVSLGSSARSHCTDTSCVSIDIRSEALTEGHVTRNPEMYDLEAGERQIEQSTYAKPHPKLHRHSAVSALVLIPSSIDITFAAAYLTIFQPPGVYGMTLFTLLLCELASVIAFCAAFIVWR